MKKFGLLLIPLMTVALLTNCNNSITITWVNENGEVLEIDKNVKKGDMPSYDSALPTKPWDDQNYYSFSGWSPEVTNVSKSQTYVATYRKIDMTGYGAYIKIEIPDYADDLKFELLCESGKTPTIDWGDGTVNESSGHNYDAPGIYDIRIGGVSLINTWVNENYIKEVYFGPEITTIMQPSVGPHPFNSCANISSVAIGKNVNYIDTESFKNTPVSSIVIDKDNCNYDSRDNCNAVITKKTLDDGTPANTLIMGFKNSIVPHGVTSIGESSFKECSLKSIVIPSEVTSIGNNAFADCASLTSVVISNGVTSIDYRAFSGCYSLVSITLPNSLTSINFSSFEKCYSLTSIDIPDSVTFLDNSIFAYCIKLTSVNIPKNITTVSEYIFEHCLSLQNLIIPRNITTIGSYAFNSCISLTSITIPDSVTLIEDKAFSDSVFLATIDLSEYSSALSVPEVEQDAFFNCSPNLKFKVLNLEMANAFKNSGKGWPQDINKYTW